MTYDIFISYSSLDRAWAKKLAADLTGLKVKCFVDEDRLTKGGKWEPQLVTSLTNSRHFVVLWSQNAHNSDWVTEELSRFKIGIDPKSEGQPLPGRLLYAINLEGQNATLAAYQGYQDSAIQKAYRELPPGQAADRLDPSAQQAWNTWVAEIAAAVSSDNPAFPVPVAVLALTTGIFNAAPPMKPEFSFVPENSLDEFLLRLGVEKMSDLSGRYGADPFHWHPFGSPETVKDMVDSLLSDPQTGINLKLAELRQPPVRWSPYLDIVTPALDRLEQITQPLASGPCLVIIDPVSLFSARIWQRYSRLSRCFLNPQAAIIFLTPSGSDQPLLFLRQCLTEQGKPHLDWFHDPIPYNPGYANCGINIADKWDMRRLVLASLGRQPSTRRPSGAEHITS